MGGGGGDHEVRGREPPASLTTGVTVTADNGLEAHPSTAPRTTALASNRVQGGATSVPREERGLSRATYLVALVGLAIMVVVVLSVRDPSRRPASLATAAHGVPDSDAFAIRKHDAHDSTQPRRLTKAPCHASVCSNVNSSAVPLAIMPVSRYPAWDVAHLVILILHDVTAAGIILGALHNFLPFRRCGRMPKGSALDTPEGKARAARHKCVGRLTLFYLVPISIIPALFIAWVWRPQYPEHPHNNFFNAFLVRVIGLYGISFLATALSGLTFFYRSKSAVYRWMWVFHAFNTAYWLYSYVWILSFYEVFGGEPKAFYGKVTQVVREMTFIVLAFGIWEPTNCYVLYKYGALIHSDLKGMPLGLYHKMNMHYLFVLCWFGPALFFWHDTHFLFTPENGFANNGLPWWVKTLGMMLTTVVPILGPQWRSYVRLLKGAWHHNRGRNLHHVASVQVLAMPPKPQQAFDNPAEMEPPLAASAGPTMLGGGVALNTGMADHIVTDEVAPVQQQSCEPSPGIAAPRPFQYSKMATSGFYASNRSGYSHGGSVHSHGSGRSRHSHGSSHGSLSSKPSMVPGTVKEVDDDYEDDDDDDGAAGRGVGVAAAAAGLADAKPE